MTHRPIARRPGARLLAAIVALAAAGVAPGAAPPTGAESDLEELGTTLKAAVLSGALSEDEAMKAYALMAERLGAGGGKGGGTRDPTGPDPMLAAPRPERVRTLFVPVFLRRDLPRLRDALDLDEDQVLICRVLLDDAIEAQELASAPLRTALAAYRRTTTDRWLEVALDRARVPDADAVAARARVAAESWTPASEEADPAAAARRRAKIEAWVDLARRADERLAALRERVQAELADLDPDAVTAENLVRLAERLRGDRERLRADTEASLRAVATAAQRGPDDGRFTLALARIRVDHLLPLGRLGGERMDLEAALAEVSDGKAVTRGEARGFDEAARVLAAALPGIAERLDRRTEATIDRELAGLRFLAERDRIAAANGTSAFEVGERRQMAAIRPFVDAARREVTASVHVRDALMALLDASVRACREIDGAPAPARAYRAAALRRGFPLEMRRRWSERAVAAALRLDDLTADVRTALAALATENATVLAAHRAAAVAERLRRDPELARRQIDARFGDGLAEKPFGAERWLGMAHEAFRSVDDQAEGRLRGLLTAAQFEALPHRPRVTAKGADESAGKRDRKAGGRGQGKDVRKGGGA